jgi:hypothetical protein
MKHDRQIYITILDDLDGAEKAIGWEVKLSKSPSIFNYIVDLSKNPVKSYQFIGSQKENSLIPCAIYPSLMKVR